MMYLAFRPKFSEVSDKRPFSGFVGKKMTTKIPSAIAVNPESRPKKYSFVLEDGTGYNVKALDVKAEIPVGTEFVINNAELHTGRVSGTTSAYLFGTIILEDIRYEFEYTWGHYHSLQVDKPYWTFEQAFWQETELMEKFFIKVP